METLLYWLARTLVAIIQVLPLRTVARIGRACGAIAFWLDARHRKVALENLQLVFRNEKSSDEIRAIAKENFCRLGENFCSAVKTAVMTPEQMKRHFVFTALKKFFPIKPTPAHKVESLPSAISEILNCMRGSDNSFPFSNAPRHIAR